MLKSFVEERFPGMFEKSAKPKGKLFLQDSGDPSQNSKLSCYAIDRVGCCLFKIPTRSPNFNPIDNMFHNIRQEVKIDTQNKYLEEESYT